MKKQSLWGRLRTFTEKKLPNTARKQSINSILSQQIEIALEAVELADLVLSDQADAQKSRKPMKKIENEGDGFRVLLLEQVDLSLTLPLEREDLVRASRAIDDVVDHLRDLVREMAKWKVDSGRWSNNILKPAELSLKTVGEAITENDLDLRRKLCMDARYQARQLRRTYQNGLEAIFSEELSIQTLARREILRRVDSIGLRLVDTIDYLMDGLVKRYL